MKGLIMGSSVKIHINGSFSKSIPIKRGVWQGCPLAPTLFAITTQPLLAFLKEERTKGRMRGLQISNSLHLCKHMFAYDMGILIPTTQQCFNEVEESISLYEQASSAKLNIQKSIVLPIGLTTIPSGSGTKDT